MNIPISQVLVSSLHIHCIVIMCLLCSFLFKIVVCTEASENCWPSNLNISVTLKSAWLSIVRSCHKSNKQTKKRAQFFSTWKIWGSYLIPLILRFCVYKIFYCLQQMSH